MKTLVGFTFTEIILKQLSNAGFNFIRSDSTLNKGYYQNLLLFASHSDEVQALEIREVIDENLYFQNQTKKDFAPFVTDLDFDSHLSCIHPNSVYQINRQLQEQDFTDASKLHVFLKLRKLHPIWAIQLSCHQFEKIKTLSHSEFIFSWQENEALLIHLGTSCFDLLVTQK
ncbi:MAG: hypothetical protein KDD45_13340 [Bdellovibrionales bacterium]|nr:hypothetical protein [Bdellovibrionales bacterium]